MTLFNKIQHWEEFFFYECCWTETSSFEYIDRWNSISMDPPPLLHPPVIELDRRWMYQGAMEKGGRERGGREEVEEDVSNFSINSLPHSPYTHLFPRETMVEWRGKTSRISLNQRWCGLREKGRVRAGGRIEGYRRSVLRHGPGVKSILSTALCAAILSPVVFYSVIVGDEAESGR